MRRWLRRLPLMVIVYATGALLASGCSGDDDDDDQSSPYPPYTVSGTVTFDWVRANDGVSAGEATQGLDFSSKTAKPARRIVVQAIDATQGTVLDSTTTDDQGHYSINVTAGRRSIIRAAAQLQTGDYSPDSGSSAHCNGASWNVKVVNNTQDYALYVLDSSSKYAEDHSDADLHAALEFNNGYSTRDSAPFAILDGIINELELACEGKPDIAFPAVTINWSPDNVPDTDSSGEIDYDRGYIGTSHYTSFSGAPNMYILGKEDVDTDEFDDHVLAHEFGHYLEDQLFRADNIGGSHASNDSLDPRVAFGEGYGDAISGMTFNDPIYVDTGGPGEAYSFDIVLDEAPVSDDQGVYSEASVQYLLWKLYENRDGTPNSGDFGRIYFVLKEKHTDTGGLTTVQSFAAYYNSLYGGDAEGLKDLWSSNTALNTSFNSLCTGPCTGSGDAADVLDSDNDIGADALQGYATTRRYPQGASGKKYDAEFWRLYKELSPSVAFVTNGHDQAVLYGDDSSSPWNKFGAERWYFFVGRGSSVTISTSSVKQGSQDIGCSQDVLDMDVFDRGEDIVYDYAYQGATAGCPKVTFQALKDEPYVVTLSAYDNVSSWTINISP